MLELDHTIKLVITPEGERMLQIETDLHLEGNLPEKQYQLHRFLNIAKSGFSLELADYNDLTAPISSGSFATAGMIGVPSSMGSLGRIASGVSTNLIERAADVMLKERRPLVLVPREAPLSEIHLQNMLTLRRAGADVLPAIPGFYHRPKSISDLVNMVVGKILDRLGIENEFFKRWKGEGMDEFLVMEDG